MPGTLSAVNVRVRVMASPTFRSSAAGSHFWETSKRVVVTTGIPAVTSGGRAASNVSGSVASSKDARACHSPRTW